MSDALACGRRFRTFNVIDDFSRHSVHIAVDTSINAGRLVRVFEQIKHGRGLPKVIRTDNGPEFLAEAFKQWSKDNGVALKHIQAGNLNQNAFIACLNRSFREDARDQNLFASLEEVRDTTRWWFDYNEIRPHDPLNGAKP